jgi:dihydrofolate synthase/folylpolyglutamate synthase
MATKPSKPATTPSSQTPPTGKVRPDAINRGRRVRPETPREGGERSGATAGTSSRLLKASDISSYDDAHAYLMQAVDLERAVAREALRDEYKLDRMRALCAKLGDPQNEVRSVHIAGTKGKGSTCEMVATCLEHCGYAVGLYTSPHMVDIRERVRLNRRQITTEQFVEAACKVAAAAERLEPPMGRCTFFELTTAMAFQHFADMAVDVAVVEVGLGGLLDCTNVIMPEVAAVALIGMDHTEILGSTIESIATQKGGIYKPGVPALAIEQSKPAIEALRACAQRAGSPFEVVGKDIEFTCRYEVPPARRPVRASADQARTFGPVAHVTLASERNLYEHVPVPLLGEHQAQNAGLALAVLDKLSERGFSCPAPAVTAGMEAVRLPGRFELLNTSPRLLLDGAHNPESMQALMKTISQQLPSDSMVCLFGCAADKDAASILRFVAGGADKVIFVAASGNARAAKPADLQRRFDAISDGKMSQTAASVKDGLDVAVRAAGREGLVCVTGSFYIVGEVKRLLAEKLGKR